MPPTPLWLDRAVTGGILFLVLFSPLTFGSVHPWAFALMQATVFLLLAVWMGWLVVAGSGEHGAGSGEHGAWSRKQEKAGTGRGEQSRNHHREHEGHEARTAETSEVRDQRSEGPHGKTLCSLWLSSFLRALRLPVRVRTQTGALRGKSPASQNPQSAIRNPQFKDPQSERLQAPSSMLHARRLALPLALFFAFIGFQLLPLPPSLLRVISPSTFELYTQTLPGWPDAVPYAELLQRSEVRDQRSAAQHLTPGTQHPRSQRSEVGDQRSPIHGLPSALSNPQSEIRNSPAPVLLPTLGEVKGGAPVPSFEGQRSEVRDQKSESNSQFEIRNPQSPTPSTWLPLSLAPSRSGSDLLKLACYAALFFLVLLYPFGEARGQRSEVGGQRSGINSQFAIRNSQFPISLLLLFIVSSGLIVAALGFVQRFTWNGMILWFFVPYDWGAASPGNDPRASGPFVSPDHFANYLALVFPLALGAAIHSRRLFRKEVVGAVRIFVGLAAFVIFTGILLSLCRSVWLAMLPGVSLLLWLSGSEARGAGSREHGAWSKEQNGKQGFHHRGAEDAEKGQTIYRARSAWRKTLRSLRLRGEKGSAIRLAVIVISLLLIAGLFFVGPRGREQVDIRVGASITEDAGLLGRTSVWSDTLKMVREFPFLGVGLGSWQDLFQRYQSPPWVGSFYREAHNDYVELLAETGIIGFVLLAWFFWLGGRILWRHLRTSAEPRSRALVAMLCSALGIMTFHEVFDFSLQIPANAFLFTLLFALALRIAAGAQSADQEFHHRGAESTEKTGQIYQARDARGKSLRTLRLCGELLGNWKSAIRNWLGSLPFLRPLTSDFRPLTSGFLLLALSLLLFFAALRQEMVPYPYNLKMPGSAAEAREMILAHPALPTPRVYMLRLMHERAPFEWEIEDIGAALWLDPNNPSLRDLYAAALLRAGSKEAGLKEISRSIVNAPSFAGHAYLNGRFLPWLSADEKNAVEQGFKEAMARGYPGAMDGLASLYSRTGRFAEEGKLFEAAAGQANEAIPRAGFAVKAATSYLKAGDPKRAEMLLRKAIAIVPGDPRPYHTLAVLIYAPQKEIDKAARLISEGIKNRAPRFELHLSLAEAMKAAGETERSEAALKSAEEALQSAAASNGNEPYGLYIALADTARRLGFRDRAKSALAGALDLHPSSPEALSRLAQLHLQDRDFNRAAYYFRSIINVNPAASDAYYHLAVAEESQYRFAAAGAAYTRAIELAPENGGYRQRYEAFKARVERNRSNAER